MEEAIINNTTLIISLIGTIIGAITGFATTFLIEVFRNRHKKRSNLRQLRDSIYVEIIHFYLNIKDKGVSQIDEHEKDFLIILKIKCFIYGSKEVCKLIDLLDKNMDDQNLNRLIEQARKELIG